MPAGMLPVACDASCRVADEADHLFFVRDEHRGSVARPGRAAGGPAASSARRLYAATGNDQRRASSSVIRCLACPYA